MRLLPILLFLVSAIPVDRSLAQSLECDADDEECLWDDLRLGCEQTDSLAETCLVLVRRIESHQLSGYPAWRVAAAYGYFYAANLTRSDEAAASLRVQSRSIFEEVTATWPESLYAGRAYLGLATIETPFGDIDNKIAALRNAVRIEPRGTRISFLADALADRGEEGDVSEAADLYRTAFMGSGDPPTWVYAQRAIGLYAVSGQPEREAAFRDQIARDSGMAVFAEEVTSANFAEDLGRAETVLETACNRFVAAIFGPDTCEEGIEAMVAATRSVVDLARRQAIADITTQAMSELSVLGAYTRVTGAEQAEREDRFAIILQEWIDSGVATARVYVSLANNPNSDRNERRAALERAVELAPDNGQYRYWLALVYRDQGRLDDAIEHMRLARDNVPDNVGLAPDRIDERIRELERARAIRP